MKEKEPAVLEVTAVRNMDVPELKMIVCCDNPVTGECLNVCYLEDEGDTRAVARDRCRPPPHAPAALLALARCGLGRMGRVGADMRRRAATGV